ncbi:MAG: hypothetical protein K8T91_15550 [Planctomycetes bacterium]|nr:hypothetical protein [Planctomycetota bacterium]
MLFSGAILLVIAIFILALGGVISYLLFGGDSSEQYPWPIRVTFRLIEVVLTFIFG